jgi:hypothetical protein
LMIAVQMNHVQLVECLLKKVPHEQIDIPDNVRLCIYLCIIDIIEGFGVLCLIIQCNSTRINPLQSHETPLMFAARKNYQRIVELLLANGVSIDIRHPTVRMCTYISCAACICVRSHEGSMHLRTCTFTCLQYGTAAEMARRSNLFEIASLIEEVEQCFV